MFCLCRIDRRGNEMTEIRDNAHAARLQERHEGERTEDASSRLFAPGMTAHDRNVMALRDELARHYRMLPVETLDAINGTRNGTVSVRTRRLMIAKAEAMLAALNEGDKA